MFVATKLLTWLASPLGIFIGLGGIGAWMLLRGRRRATARLLITIAAFQLVLFAWHPIADALIAPLEARARRMAAEAPQQGYSAILVLGGAMSTPPVGSKEMPLVREGFARILFAAHLYHAGVAPRIIASGGSFELPGGVQGTSEAEGIRDMLVLLRVPREAIILEETSRNTRENARESARILGKDAKVALVTSAFHMPRATREMDIEGLKTHAFPTDFRARSEERPYWEQWVPGPDALARSTTAIKEWLGRAVLAMR